MEDHGSKKLCVKFAILKVMNVKVAALLKKMQ